MNSSHLKDKSLSNDNAEVADKSPSDKDNIATSSALVQEFEISNRSYEDLSLEFQKLYPYAMRAFELIPLMYNRLTLVDKLSHKEALTKIYDDHKHLSGFSQRNIRRYLPSDNQVTPRRVRPPRPKNSFAEIIEPTKLSITQQEQSQSSLIDHQETTLGDNNNLLQEESNEKGVGRNQITKPLKDSQFTGHTVNEKALEEGQCLDCLLLSIKIDVLKEALTKATQFTKTDQISTHEIQFTIPKEKYSQLKAAMDNSTNSVYVIFDKSGILERAEPEYS